MKLDENIILQKIRNSNNIKKDILNFIISIDQRKTKINKTLKNQYEELILKIFKEFQNLIDVDIVNYYYWYTDLAVGIVSQIIDNKYDKPLTKIINHMQTVPCKECGKLYERHFSSRQEYKRVVSYNTYFTCDECEKKRLNLQEEDELLIKQERLDKEKVLNQQIEDLKNIPYKEYLKTDHWKEVRNKALYRAKYKCQLCSSKENLNVHHNTYENRGQEKDQDLVVLCQKCHGKFHDKFVEDKNHIEEDENLIRFEESKRMDELLESVKDKSSYGCTSKIIVAGKEVKSL